MEDSSAKMWLAVDMVISLLGCAHLAGAGGWCNRCSKEIDARFIEGLERLFSKLAVEHEFVPFREAIAR